MNVELLSFSSTNYYLNKIIIEKEAKDLGIFNKIVTYNEYDLDNKFHDIIKERMYKYGSRLFGYASWKPYLILNELEKLEDGDILTYVDSDFTSLNENKEHKIEMFNNIFENLSNGEYCIFGYQGESSNDLSYTTTKLRKCIESYLGYTFNKDELVSPQFASGIMNIRKCEKSIDIIRQWNNIIQDNFDLITDVHNKDNDNDQTFIENRHEQSVWSLLCKHYNKFVYDTSISIYNEFMNRNYDYSKYNLIKIYKRN